MIFKYPRIEPQPVCSAGAAHPSSKRNLQTWGVSLQAPPCRRAAEGAAGPSCGAPCSPGSCGATRRRGRGSRRRSPALGGAAAAGADPSFPSSRRKEGGRPASHWWGTQDGLPCQVPPPAHAAGWLSPTAASKAVANTSENSRHGAQPGTLQSGAAWPRTHPGSAPSWQNKT